MKTIDTRNVNTAMAQAVPYLLKEGVVETSRVGRVLVAPGPVMTIYNQPKEHILFGPARNANPFFHLFESLWMLAGRNDIAYPAQFNKRMLEFSDDGEKQWGAYGFRWRNFFGFDQLAALYHELKKNPNTRRAVLSMWSADGDLTEWEQGVGGIASKDVPCNTHAYFDMRGGVLNMTVCNRSNDMVWGCYGANAVHFAILLEYMAEQLGVPMGVYRQFSNNFHAYLDIYSEDKLLDIASDAAKLNLYNIYPTMKTIPLGSTEEGWGKALHKFLDGEVDWAVPSFFTKVAGPMYFAWLAYREGGYPDAFEYLKKMEYCDWQVAALDWMDRKKEKKGKTDAA